MEREREGQGDCESVVYTCINGEKEGQQSYRPSPKAFGNWTDRLRADLCPGPILILYILPIPMFEYCDAWELEATEQKA